MLWVELAQLIKRENVLPFIVAVMFRHILEIYGTLTIVIGLFGDGTKYYNVYGITIR